MRPSTKHSYPNSVRLSLLGHLIIFAAILTPYFHEEVSGPEPDIEYGFGESVRGRSDIGSAAEYSLKLGVREAEIFISRGLIARSRARSINVSTYRRAKSSGIAMFG
jgi:hypothetical protein